MLLLALAAEQHTKSPSLLELLTDFHVCAATATCAAARANVKLQKCGIVVRGMASMEAKFSLSVGESNHISNFFSVDTLLSPSYTPRYHFMFSFSYSFFVSFAIVVTILLVSSPNEYTIRLVVERSVLRNIYESAIHHSLHINVYGIFHLHVRKFE